MLTSIAAQLGVECPDDVTFATQLTDDAGARPDIVGRLADGSIPIIVEAKFWAGLTAAQPMGYLRSLPPKAGLLLFVAPGMRADTLWAELSHRSTGGNAATPRATAPTNALQSLSVEGRVLALISWRGLIGAMRAAVERSSDLDASSDLAQLEGLCDRMDAEAFLPLTSEELTSPIARRIIQFGELADELANRLVATGNANVKGLRASAANGWSGRYIRLRGFGCLLYFSAHLWARWGESPIWLKVKGMDWKPSRAVRDTLLRTGILFHETEDGCYVPIRLPIAAERDLVLASSIAQLELVADALSTISSTGMVVAPPPAEAVAGDDNDQQWSPPS